MLFDRTHLLPLFKPPEKGCIGADVQDMCGDGETVIQETGDLGKHGPDVLCPGGNLDAKEVLDCEGVRLLVAHHGDVVQTIEIG